jgi:hypothetical protein
MNNTVPPHPQAHEPGHLALPRFERIKYFYGQLLGVREFQSEQRYFVDKHRLHNRYLHGYGVVCGLEVAPVVVTPDPCAPEHVAHAAPGTPHAYVEIAPGLALDCLGNEIAVAWPTRVDLLAQLGRDDRAAFLEGRPAYLSVCFVEQPIELVRPLAADSCGGLVPECVPSRLRDDFCVRVSLDKPAHDRSCTACDRPCSDPCLPLAVAVWHHGHVHVDSSIRRAIAPFVATRIAGVSWVHDGVYRPALADHMMRDGLVIQFSDDVHVASLRRGVIDVWVIQGGGGRRGDLYNVPIEVIPGNPGGALTRTVIARVPAQRGDRIDPGDRVLVQLRSGFVLDRCCRAVDGENIGGLVPQLADYAARWPSVTPPLVAPCHRPEPRSGMPWTSGDGAPAGSFESWFYIGDDDHEHKRG